MKKKKGALVWAGAVASVVVFVVWLVYATVNETPPYAFMRGAKQDGFWVPEGMTHQVRRFYRLPGEYRSAGEDARRELTAGAGWVESHHENWIRGDVTVTVLRRLDGSNSAGVVIGRNSTALERRLGPHLKWIPSWF